MDLNEEPVIGDVVTYPALFLDEPFASGVFVGLKGWETRSAPPNGNMRPDGVRGFPGARINRGDRIIIGATARKPLPVSGWEASNKWGGELAMYQSVEGAPPVHERMLRLHRGCILGTVAVVDAVPITDTCRDHSPHVCWSGSALLAHSDLRRPWPDEQTEIDISDQIPWGDWRPGRWAWLLEDPIPMTFQCSWCDGEGAIRAAQDCPACDGAGSCDPIPVRGHQGLRPIKPEQLR